MRREKMKELRKQRELVPLLVNGLEEQIISFILPGNKDKIKPEK
jgi:hypothetical protein